IPSAVIRLGHVLCSPVGRQSSCTFTMILFSAHFLNISSSQVVQRCEPACTKPNFTPFTPQSRYTRNRESDCAYKPCRLQYNHTPIPFSFPYFIIPGRSKSGMATLVASEVNVNAG